MSTALAPAKINLALLVGPIRADGKHEVVTLLERLALADRVTVEPAPTTTVEGFADDTIVSGALLALARRAGHEAGWRVVLEKHVPVAAGLGGGSSDAATALELANGTLTSPLTADELHALAAGVGADVPFFLTRGPQLGEADGTALSAVFLPRAYTVLLSLPDGAVKESTASVYAAYDARDGAGGFDARRAELLRLLPSLRRAEDLTGLPANDLASSPLAVEMRRLGAFRADVSGAGPVVYGLFTGRGDAERAADVLAGEGRVWVTRPL